MITFCCTMPTDPTPMTKPIQYFLRPSVLFVLCTLALVSNTACRRRPSAQTTAQSPMDSRAREALDARAAQLLVSLSGRVDPHSTAPRPPPLTIASASAIVGALRSTTVPLQLALVHPYTHLNEVSQDASPGQTAVRSGHIVLQTHEVSQSERDPLIDGLLGSQQDPSTSPPAAQCFNPRQAILFSLNGVEYQWIISVQCSQAQLWIGDQLMVGSVVTEQPFVSGLPAAVTARQMVD